MTIKTFQLINWKSKMYKYNKDSSGDILALTVRLAKEGQEFEYLLKFNCLYILCSCLAP